MLFLLFRIGRGRFALESQAIIEVLPLLDVQEFVRKAPGVAGVLPYRGGLIPVIDLSDGSLGRPSARRLSTRIIVASACNRDGEVLRAGLVAEGATELARFDPEDFKPAGISTDDPYIGPVAHGPHGAVQRVDVAKLIAPALQQGSLATLAAAR